MFQQFNFDGTGRIINARGDYIRYERGNGADVSIRLRVDGQDLGIFIPGDSVRLPKPFSACEVTPVAGAYGLLRIGNGDVRSERLVGDVTVTGTVGIAGTVTAEDVPLTRAYDDRAKYWSVNTHDVSPGAPGSFSHVHLWNPPNSGKRMVVRQISISPGPNLDSPGDTMAHCLIYFQDLTLSGPAVSVAETRPRAKRIGPSLSLMQGLIVSTSGMETYAEKQMYMWRGWIPVGSTQVVTPQSPWVFEPDMGFSVSLLGDGGRHALDVNVEWDEEDE